jgi:hypothetical protein
LSGAAAEAKSLAADLKQSLGRITDPALKELIIKDGAKLITDHTTLADEAVIDPARLQHEYAEWQDLERNGPKDQRGKRFDDWLREERTSRQSSRDHRSRWTDGIGPRRSWCEAQLRRRHSRGPDSRGWHFPGCRNGGTRMRPRRALLRRGQLDGAS